jgi:hypothetical protein
MTPGKEASQARPENVKDILWMSLVQPKQQGKERDKT